METSALFDQVVGHIGDFLETDVTHLKLESRVSSAVPGLDSFKLFEMLVYLEDCFQIEFDDSVMENIGTVSDLVDHIQTLIAGQPKGD